MGRFNYNGPSEYEPLGAWNYFGLTILYGLPLIGFIILIIHALGATNYNKRSFARSFFCGVILLLIVIGVSAAIGIAGAGFSGLIDKIKEIFNNI